MAVFVILSLSGGFLISFCVSLWNGQIEYNAGVTSGIFLPSIPKTFIYGLIASLVIVVVSARIARLELTLDNCFIVSGAVILVSLVVSIMSNFIGVDANKRFLDGFRMRIVDSGMESNAVNWADQIFNDTSLNTNRFEEIYLRGGKVPRFLNELFVGEQPEAVVCYNANSVFPERVEIRKSNAVEWGLFFVRNTNSVSHWQFRPKPEYCGNRIYVYVYYYR